MTKKSKLLVLATLFCFGMSLALFVGAMEDQSIRLSGMAEPVRMSLQQFIRDDGVALNRHIELTDFEFGNKFIYDTKLVQFRDVYLPVFPKGATEDANKLKLLIWIRNDAVSNQPLIETREQVRQFVYQTHPGTITGVLRKPTTDVTNLARETYPDINTGSLQILWARRFPSQNFINVIWTLCFASALAGIAFATFAARARSAK